VPGWKTDMRDRIMLPKVNLSKLSPHGYRRAEYYDERIGLSVCLSVYEHIPELNAHV